MTTRPAEIDETVADVCARARERLPGDDGALAEAFIRRYYRWVPPEDIAASSAHDLYGAALSHLDLARRREPGRTAVRVYNPEIEHDGWRSIHTTIDVVSDDMPFLVDSVSIALHRRGLAIHRLIHPVVLVERDGDGRLRHVADHDAEPENGDAPATELAESVMHVEVDRVSDPSQLRELRGTIERVLIEVRAAVQDWQSMRERAIALADEIDTGGAGPRGEEASEAAEFLRWMADEHFVFLGYRDYDAVDAEGVFSLVARESSGLGILRKPPARKATELPPARRDFALEPHHLVLTKANSKATIHRPAYLDYVGVRRFDADGRVVGERRFLGLYTSAAYKESPGTIPLLRGKFEYVLRRAGFPPNSHDRKALVEIVESYPRAALFQIAAEELFDVAMGVLALGERQRVRLFARRDPLDRFVSCLVYIPRDRFNTESRERVGGILLDAFGGDRLDWDLLISESINVRVHYIVHCADGPRRDVEVAEIETRLAAAVRAWADDLRDALRDEHGEERGGRLMARYGGAFPPAYTSDWVARAALADIDRIESLSDREPMSMSLYRPLEGDRGTLRCKLISAARVPLSEVLPTFENMGATVLDERPYEVRRAGADAVWIYDFGLRCKADSLDEVREPFREAFLGTRRGDYEDDGLNALVLRAGMSARDVTVLRAVAKYLRQAGIAFTEGYMQRTLIEHDEAAQLLVALFRARFHLEERDEQEAARIAERLREVIDAVRSLDEDRILRAFLSVISAIVRTNFYRPGEDGGIRPWVSFKVLPDEISLLPFPRPKFEIFVYSPRVEGVHLRGGRVARGGLRWSDRREDFRTEILGLMKAQMVKNALIVPVGSKGGFVVKQPPAGGGREALMQEAVACYRTFLRGLLDLTDNIEGGEIVPPESVVRYDEDDPYLVVAADKGTASFSDIANEVSAEYGFWLGDAFASGGSQGYDHKAMGITARGAWESVKRHFRELGTDIQSEAFTVVGVGDMAGDVFGNGMLLSPHIRLIAAFNHQHVFLDPDPDPERSLEERRRLFGEPRSSWSDYDPDLISEGGGVHERTAKSIKLSEAARRALGIDDEELAPNELIRAILRAPVDLLWNGGIGTYVRASGETDAEAGDKANDAVRVEARELRCRVVGEGGNLGFTQRGRIEFARAGGAVNTDAIDNVAGVNCSDHEVNIKILLGAVVDNGDLTVKQRNELLHEMTDSVAEQVLYGSYTQTQAISLAAFQATSMIDVHARLIRHLESTASLDRGIEFLPSEEELGQRRNDNEGLVAPELAVIMAYCKIHLYEELLESDLPEDPYLAHDLERYFPPPLPERFGGAMPGHRLAREIVSTVVANQLVDRAGTTFAFRLAEETGAPAARLARAYAAAREIYSMRELWSAVEGLDNSVAAETQLRMLIEARRLVERATRWLLRGCRETIEIEETVAHYARGAELLAGSMPDVLRADDRDRHTERRSALVEAGVGQELAARVAALPFLLPALDVVDVAGTTDRSIESVSEAYFELGARLELDWLRDRIAELSRANRWQALSRSALRDDLFALQRELTQEVLETSAEDGVSAVEAWFEANRSAVRRACAMVADVRASGVADTTTLPVALREVRNLIRGAADVARA